MKTSKKSGGAFQAKNVQPSTSELLIANIYFFTRTDDQGHCWVDLYRKKKWVETRSAESFMLGMTKALHRTARALCVAKP